MLWDIQNPGKKAIKKVAYHYRAISHLSFDPTGTFFVTIGGGTSNDALSLAVWKLEDLLHSSSLPIPKFVQLLSDLQAITSLTVDSRDDHVTILLGSESGLKAFSFYRDGQDLNQVQSDLTSSG